MYGCEHECMAIYFHCGKKNRGWIQLEKKQCDASKNILLSWILQWNSREPKLYNKIEGQNFSNWISTRAVNNIVHRNKNLTFMYGGCRPQSMEPEGRPQEYENVHNIYLLDDMPDDFNFARSNDRGAIQWEYWIKLLWNEIWNCPSQDRNWK